MAFNDDPDEMTSSRELEASYTHVRRPGSVGGDDDIDLVDVAEAGARSDVDGDVDVAIGGMDEHRPDSPDSMDISRTGSLSSDERLLVQQHQHHQQQQQQHRRSASIASNSTASSTLPRADDHAHMMKTIIPEDPELEVLEQTYQTWTIRDWTQQPKRGHGPTFSCGDAEW
ncbi:hypothetical protein KEM52_002721 [Ascosphaera acerosa]|nr:hypothetical protein KEM52_002721 [Ascosphaera acerosa]